MVKCIEPSFISFVLVKMSSASHIVLHPLCSIFIYLQSLVVKQLSPLTLNQVSWVWNSAWELWYFSCEGLTKPVCHQHAIVCSVCQEFTCTRLIQLGTFVEFLGVTCHILISTSHIHLTFANANAQVFTFLIQLVEPFKNFLEKLPFSYSANG